MRSSKKRRLYSLLALCLAIGILSGAYFLLKDRFTEEEPEDETPAISITSFSSEDIVNIKLSRRDGDILFERKEEGWDILEPYSVKLLESRVDRYGEIMSSLEAMDIVVENPDDLEPYGLKDPTVKSEVKLKDDTFVTVLVGKQTATGDSYYLMKEGDSTVYIVNKADGDALTWELSDFRDRALAKIEYERDLMLFSMSSKDMREVEIRRKDEEDQDPDLVEFNMGLLEITKPYNTVMGVDVVEFGPILEAIPTLTIEDFVDDFPEDISQYGLDDPSGRIVIKDRKNTLELILGDKTDDDKRYFQVAGSDAVYTMLDSKLDFMDIEPFDLVQKFALMVNIKDVDKIVVENKGVSHTLTLEREVLSPSTDDEEEEELVTYRADDRIVQEKAFKRFYQMLVSLSVDVEKTVEPKEDADVAVTFHLNKGKEREIRVEYVPYDRDFYSFVRDGNSDFLIARSSVEQMLEELEMLLNEG